MLLCFPIKCPLWEKLIYICINKVSTLGEIKFIRVQQFELQKHGERHIKTYGFFFTISKPLPLLACCFPVPFLCQLLSALLWLKATWKLKQREGWWRQYMFETWNIPSDSLKQVRAVFRVLPTDQRSGERPSEDMKKSKKRKSHSNDGRWWVSHLAQFYVGYTTVRAILNS